MGTKKQAILHTHGDSKIAVKKTPQKPPTLSTSFLTSIADFPCPHGLPTEKPLLCSGHSLLWKFRYKDGRPPTRAPDRLVPMRGGWERRYWYFSHGITIVAGPRTLELWAERGKKTAGSERMLARMAERALGVMLDFTNWQRIAPELTRTAHPHDLSRAHVVIESKRFNPELKPIAGREDTKETGLIFDGSHKDRPELKGPASAEGLKGFDWLTLAGPATLKHHSAALEELRAAISGLELQTEDAAKARAEVMRGLSAVISRLSQPPPEPPSASPPTPKAN